MHGDDDLRPGTGRVATKVGHAPRDEAWSGFGAGEQHPWWSPPVGDGPVRDGPRERSGLIQLVEPATPDPYELLRVSRDATWDEILAAYRRQVRWWHPDGLGEASSVEHEACEDRILELNAAYHELQIRRGR